MLMVNRGASFDTTEWAATSYTAILNLQRQEAAQLYQDRLAIALPRTLFHKGWRKKQTAW